jgi:hypothetical protein
MGAAARTAPWRLASTAIAHRASRIAHRASRIAHRCTLQTFGAAPSGHMCRENEAMDPELDSAQFLSLEDRARSTRGLRVSVASQRIAQERVPSAVRHIAVK